MQRRYIAITLLVASDCPSDCGWNAQERFNLTPVSENSSCQNLLVKTRSLSLTMELGSPWRRTMSEKKARTTEVAV
jgi:hypothetical protein